MAEKNKVYLLILWMKILSWFLLACGYIGELLCLTAGPEVMKKNFMRNSTEYEILNAHKYKNIKKFSIVQAQISRECYFSCL